MYIIDKKNVKILKKLFIYIFLVITFYLYVMGEIQSMISIFKNADTYYEISSVS